MKFSKAYFKRIVLWVIWLCAGCIFYAVDLDISYSKGLYYSVLVGYNIGWNFDEDYHPITEYYSIAHMIIGVCAVTILLEEYIQNILNTDTHWYQAVLDKEKYSEAVGLTSRIKHGIILHKYTFFPSFIWVGVLVGGSVLAYLNTAWSVADSCFFTISTLFAGGFATVPESFTNFQYLCVSLFAGMGVPLTMYCFSAIAALYVSSPHSDKFSTVCKQCEVSDLKMMQKLKLENCDGHLDKAEFIILCMLRLRAIDHELVEAINEQFESLDENKNGFVEYVELLEVSTLGQGLVSSLTKQGPIVDHAEEEGKEEDFDASNSEEDNNEHIVAELEPSNLESRFSTSMEMERPRPMSLSSATKQSAQVAVAPSPRIKSLGSRPRYHYPLSPETVSKSKPPETGRFVGAPSSLPRPPLPPTPPPRSSAVAPAAAATASSSQGSSMSAGVLLAHRVASMRKERENNKLRNK